MQKHTEDENDVIKDGHKITVPLMLMDNQQRSVASANSRSANAAMHRPGAVVLSDNDRASRAAMVDSYNKAISERWRDPAPVLPVMAVDANAVQKQAVQAGQAATLADRDQAYSAYDAKIADRWRHA